MKVFDYQLKPYEWDSLKVKYQKLLFGSLLQELSDKIFTTRCSVSYRSWKKYLGYPESRVFLYLITKRNEWRKGVQLFNRQANTDWLEDSREATINLGYFTNNLVTHLIKQGILVEINEPVLNRRILKPKGKELIIDEVKRGYLKNLFSWVKNEYEGNGFPTIRELSGYFHVRNKDIRQLGSWEKLKRLYTHWQDTQEVLLYLPEYLKGKYRLIRELPFPDYSKRIFNNISDKNG